MGSETDQDTFGSYLKSFRVDKGLEIQALSGKTKITARLIRAMEENDYDCFPPRPYVKGFIQTYAKAVNADSVVAVSLYLTELNRRDNTKQQALRRKAKLGALRRMLMAAGIITAVLLLIRFTDFFPDREPLPPIATLDRFALPEPRANDKATTGRRSPEDSPTDKLKLQVTAVEQTWLKVIVDGQSARSYDLKPEDRLELEGADNFNLMIGDATGLVILLNDRPVKIYGKKGQVVSLKIP